MLCCLSVARCRSIAVWSAYRSALRANGFLDLVPLTIVVDDSLGIVGTLSDWCWAANQGPCSCRLLSSRGPTVSLAFRVFVSFCCRRWSFRLLSFVLFPFVVLSVVIFIFVVDVLVPRAFGLCHLASLLLILRFCRKSHCF